MANDFEISIEVAVGPDVAWAAAGDPVGIADWFAPVAKIEIIDGIRHVTMGSGNVLVEELVDRNETARSYSYRVISGIPGLTSHRATIKVDEAASGARVSWRQTATSDDPDYDLERRLRAVMTQGLLDLKAVLEGNRSTAAGA